MTLVHCMIQESCMIKESKKSNDTNDDGEYFFHLMDLKTSEIELGPCRNRRFSPGTLTDKQLVDGEKQLICWRFLQVF